MRVSSKERVGGEEVGGEGVAKVGEMGWCGSAGRREMEVGRCRRVRGEEIEGGRVGMGEWWERMGGKGLWSRGAEGMVRAPWILGWGI